MKRGLYKNSFLIPRSERSAQKTKFSHSKESVLPSPTAAQCFVVTFPCHEPLFFLFIKRRHSQ